MGRHDFILPGLIPKQIYFRHQYSFEAIPVEDKGEVYFEFEKHSKDENDSEIRIFNYISF